MPQVASLILAAFTVACAFAIPTSDADFNINTVTSICDVYPTFSGCSSSIGEVDKRKSAYMRFGRAMSADEQSEMEKRKSAYMRFGKREQMDGDEANMAGLAEKRKSAYMRFGKRDVPESDLSLPEKRKSAYMRFGKRSADNTMTDTDSASFDMEKRKSAYMRFGRR
uniref:Uncharacterized protein n=1 Tax=Plectus sambesii TaxID=2011161 RepID=A0A914WDV6_9BILA